MNAICILTRSQRSSQVDVSRVFPYEITAERYAFQSFADKERSPL